MDRFLTKRKLSEKEEQETSWAVSNDVSKAPKTVVTKSRNKYRNYDESYIKYGFVSNGCYPPQPLCVVCSKTMSNATMKPSFLQRHLINNHSELKNKHIEFFKRRAKIMEKSVDKMTLFSQTSKSALETSFELAFLIAKAKKSHTAAENIIIPGALIIADHMLGDKAKAIIKTIPISDNTIARRIGEMAKDVVLQVAHDIKEDKRFALQVDESVDI